MAFFAIFRKILKSYSFIHVIIFRIFNQLKLLDQNMNANFSRPFFPVFFFPDWMSISLYRVTSHRFNFYYISVTKTLHVLLSSRFWANGNFLCLFACLFNVFFVQGNTCFCGNLYLSDKFISTYLSIGNRYRFEMGSFYRAQNRINIRRYFWE